MENKFISNLILYELNKKRLNKKLKARSKIEKENNDLLIINHFINKRNI
jgi:hypothetical protein